MRAFPWIIGGGAAAAAAAYFWTRGRSDGQRDSEADTGSPSTPDASDRPSTQGAAPAAGTSGTPMEPLPGRWVWPMGVWQDRKPEISDGYSSKRRLPSGQSVTHGGVDIMYRRRPSDPWRAGTSNGTRDWVMPDHRAAIAASDGVVWSAAKTARGWAVVIDHSPRKLATYYTHMSSLLVRAKQQVRAGTPLGIIGADPLDAQNIMHLHLEIWRGGAADRFDPQKLIETTWEYLPDPGDLPRLLVARNAGHRPADGSGFSVPVIPHYRRPPRR
jgi:murein DD-endopeptidase MepM/ murein hydrolase activator NlpD